jgi:hypothetical protein
MHLYPLLGLTLFLTVLACHKSVSDVQPQPHTPISHDSSQLAIKKDSSPVKTDSPLTKVPYPQTPVTGCSYSPKYRDSIIYPQPTTGQDYVVRPVNNPGLGKYLSWPIGMVIDSLTGAIDVTKTETGQRYAIGFVKSGTRDTCLSTLIIGGAAYMDSVYVLENGAIKAAPYFDANPYLPPICSGSGSGCSFDITGSAANQKVIVNKSSGVIDLQQTLNGTGLLGGAFGLLPLNGQTITTTIYYRLNDPSNKALQHIDVQMAYYYSKADIGQGLLSNLTVKLTNVLSGQLISTGANPRPPLIVIVRRNLRP